MIEHLGITVREKPTNHITKEQYLLAKPEGMPGWTPDDYPKQRLLAGINYDANMRFFASLDKNSFETYLQEVCRAYHFIECKDIKTLSGIEGLYILVFDDYKQFYIGLSRDIKRRIISHWNNRKSLERLIFGTVCNSILSVDSFRALDNTRVYYINETSLTVPLEIYEEKIVRKVSPQYLLNRTGGGIGFEETNTSSEMMRNVAILANRVEKEIERFVDEEELKQVVSAKEFRMYKERFPLLGVNVKKD